MRLARRLLPPLCVVLLLLAPLSATAQALPNRILVSGKGVDAAGCGTPASPCRTFQYAHDHVAAGGEVQVMDSGGFAGSVTEGVTISKSISIVNEGAGTASIDGSDYWFMGIWINDTPAPITVRLRGLAITRWSGPYNRAGIYTQNQHLSLSVENCVIRGFRIGIDFSFYLGGGSFSITNSAIEDTQYGVNIESGNWNGVINRLTANYNVTAVRIRDLTLAPQSKFTIVNSTFTNNSGSGLQIYSASAVTVSNSTASNNSEAGFHFSGSGAMRIGASVATGNAIGVFVGGKVETYGDNNLRGNGVAVSGGSLTPVAKQ